MINRIHFKYLRGDLYGGITAAIVALPLALAFGVASGAGPIAGLYGAIWLGLFAALFGGTPSQISGPTGPMTVVMATVFIEYAHSPAMAFTVVMLSGLFQILFGYLKLGRYINLMPYPVISGFMSGIGCIIVIIQLDPLLGYVTPSGVVNALFSIPDYLKTPKLDSVALGLLALALCYLLPSRINKIIPAPLLALCAGTFLGFLFFKDAPALGAVPAGLPQLQVPVFELAAVKHMIYSALVLSVLASIDSLLTSLIADNITQIYHDSDKELVGQGIGNFTAGLFGAIPGAGATMRTVINIRSGGRTPLSGIVHALLLLAIVLGLGPWVSYIPHAVLAGLLVKVGIDIIDWSYLRRMSDTPRSEVILMLTVLLLTVFVDLITAVASGVVIASLLFVKRMADLQADSITLIADPEQKTPFTKEEKQLFNKCRNDVTFIHLDGPMSFGAANSMLRRVSEAKRSSSLILDFTDVPIVDSSAALAIENIIKSVTAQHHTIMLVGMNTMVVSLLRGMQVLKHIDQRNIYMDRLTVLQQCTEFVDVAGQKAKVTLKN